MRIIKFLDFHNNQYKQILIQSGYVFTVKKNVFMMKLIYCKGILKKLENNISSCTDIYNKLTLNSNVNSYLVHHSEIKLIKGNFSMILLKYNV